MRDGRLDAKGRDKLLVSMTDEVAALVLRNNYRQTLAISLTETRGFEYFGYQRRLIQDLERRGVLDRAVESLPDEVALAERQTAGKPLTRPEIAVLVAYAKILLFDQLLAGDVADDTDARRRTLPLLPDEDVGRPTARTSRPTGCAPRSSRRWSPIRWSTAAGRPTRSGSPTVPAPRRSRSPGSMSSLREAFRLRELNDAIDALDNKVAGATQLELYQRRAASRGVADHLVPAQRVAGRRDRAGGERPSARPSRRWPGMLDRVLPERVAARLAETIEGYRAAGVPEDLAVAIARLPVLVDATDIHLVAEATGESLEAAATGLLRRRRAVADRQCDATGGGDPADRLLRRARPRAGARDHRRGASPDRHPGDQGRRHRGVAGGAIRTRSNGASTSSRGSPRRRK